MKNELKDYWEDEKRKKVIQRIEEKNINVNIPGEEKNININLNTEIENDNSIIIYLIAGVISIGSIFGVYSFVQNETKKEIEYLKVQRIIQSNEYSKNISKYKTENEEILNEKEFKIKYKSLDNSNINFYDYNINTILSNIESVYSKGTDNNYKIEIIINISKYGTFFYRIYNINTSKEYNENFIRILDEMKKIRFRENEKDTNLRITIHNNDYDLN